MITTEQVEQDLMDAGFVPHTRRGNVVYGGFRVAGEDGKTVVSYVPGFVADMKPELAREIVAHHADQLERALSKRYTVIMFVPDEGVAYRLTVLPKA